MHFLQTISVAIVAFIFVEYLTAPGQVLEFYYQWLEGLHRKGRTWLAKPLGLCGICFSGQVGLWWYAIAYRDEWILGDHIIFTCQVIFFFLVLKTIQLKNATTT